MGREQAADAILAHLPAVVYQLMPRPPWRIVDWTPASDGFRGIGDTLAACDGDWSALIHPAERQAAIASLEAAISRGRAASLVHRLPEPWDECSVLNRTSIKWGTDGQVERVIGLMIDVSAERREWEALKDTESTFHAYVDSSRHLRWTADAQGRLQSTGDRWLELFGESADPCADWTESLHERDRDRVLDAWQHSLETGERFDERYRLRLPTGEYRWFRSRAAPRRDDAGHIVKWYGVFEDINEAELAQQELEWAERRYALAAQATGEIVWEWDLETGRVHRAADSSLLAKLGIEADSDRRTNENRIHPDDRERVVASLDALAQGRGESWTSEFRVRVPSGDYAHVLNRGFLVRDESGCPERLVGATQDVTAQRRAEQEMRELQRELVQMSELNAAATIATNLAHELNQPLTACANYLAQVRMILRPLDGADACEAADTAERAEEQVLRAGQAVRRMRSLVRDGRPSDAATSFDEVVEWVARLMRVSSGCPDATLRRHGDGGRLLLAADRIQLAQVMLNLATQACEIAGRPRPELLVSSRVDDGAATVIIRTPPQIADAMAQRMRAAFDGNPAVGTDRLSIARTLIEMIGGRIWATSEADGSVAFHFTVPVGPEGVAQVPRRPSPAREERC